MRATEQKLRSFRDDTYNRQIIAENLTKIIDSQNDSIVISLDSEWGTGKTTFVTMWKDMLDSEEKYNSKFETLYFNAWENDYIKDPLLAIFSEMEKQIHDKDTKFNKEIDKMKIKAKPFGKMIVSSAIKLATAGILNLDGVTLGDFNEEELIKLSEKLGELSVKEISADKTIRVRFKEEMTKYQSDVNKKIIFFIDELDRCRPTFAIELLEVVKHLFNIENFIFVLSIDKQQLSHSVSTIYGQNSDTIGYLRRFIDLDYKLPQLNLKTYIRNKSNLILKEKCNIELFEMFIEEMFINENFSLRDVDKAFYYINILIPLIKEFNEKGNYKSVYIATISYLYATLITIKIKRPILYKKIIDNEYQVDDIIGQFNIPNLDHYKDNLIGGWHQKPLQEVIEPILKLYLQLNIRFHKEEYVYESYENEFAVGHKKEDGTFGYDNKFNLKFLFERKNSNIINKLEFIDSFEIN
ncbi:MAG: P-loop NTPase fold protein [Clostridium sp.]|uniref:KAP family P-loop NTPase fold protein n=1 Tax=Clostridium sp. TaxID=1506 RepID=UPI00290C5DDE|nr:P-loop NTPase fold protein [Clostridium sp.]MDU5109769.1 P-loop NTPase fold protein [Clostridium sp.]